MSIEVSLMRQPSTVLLTIQQSFKKEKTLLGQAKRKIKDDGYMYKRK